MILIPETAEPHLKDALAWLRRSEAADSFFMRSHCVIAAAQALHRAAAADPARRKILTAHAEHAAELAGVFWGDGRGVSRLTDELADLETTFRTAPECRRGAMVNHPNRSRRAKPAP